MIRISVACNESVNGRTDILTKELLIVIRNIDRGHDHLDLIKNCDNNAAKHIFIKPKIENKIIKLLIGFMDRRDPNIITGTSNKERPKS